MARMLKALVDCSALKNNLARVRAVAKNKKVLAMIKANGYGHGLVNVAKALKDADAFGVACIEEAVKLRAAGINHRIFLMQGFFNAEEELPEIVELELEPVVHHHAQVVALQHCKAPIRLWLKINTGMNRLGFTPADFQVAWQTLSKMPNLSIQGFMTHFSRADELHHPETELQMARFLKAIEGLPGEISLANSAGILGWPSSHGDWVRPGIMLYGISPFPEQIGADLGLTSVMTLHSEIIAIQSAQQKEAIGYGGTFVCPDPMRIGVVAVGYGDGYPRLAPNGTPVLVNGHYAPLVGRVSMDMITVDLSKQPNAKVGDPVQLWGPDLPVESVAQAIGTSAYELLAGLSARVPIEAVNLSLLPALDFN